jgi:hypothetical protein
MQHDVILLQENAVQDYRRRNILAAPNSVIGFDALKQLTTYTITALTGQQLVPAPTVAATVSFFSDYESALMWLETARACDRSDMVRPRELQTVETILLHVQLAIP